MGFFGGGFRQLYLQVVLHDHHRGVRQAPEDLVQGPAVVPGDLVVALELLVLRLHRHVRQVRLPQVSHPVPIRPDHLGRVGVAAVLADHDGVELLGGAVLQQLVQAAPHRHPVASDDQDGNDGLGGGAGGGGLGLVGRVPQRLVALDLQQDLLLHLQLGGDAVGHLQHVSHHVAGGLGRRLRLLRPGQLGGRGSAPQQEQQDGIPGDQQERAEKNQRSFLAEHGPEKA